MDFRDIHVVTGAFGFSGKYIAERLLAAGYSVRTPTNSLHRENPFHDGVARRQREAQTKASTIQGWFMSMIG